MSFIEEEFKRQVREKKIESQMIEYEIQQDEIERFCSDDNIQRIVSKIGEQVRSLYAIHEGPIKEVQVSDSGITKNIGGNHLANRAVHSALIQQEPQTENVRIFYKDSGFTDAPPLQNITVTFEPPLQ